MGSKVIAIAGLVVLVLLLSGTVRAEGDEVVLKTGMILKGTILSRNAKRLRMDVEGLGKMDVPLSNVRSINGEDPTGVVDEPEPAEPAEDVPDPATEPPEEQPVSRVDVAYDDLQEGQTLLFILAGKDHGDWLETGPRVIATLARVGKRRFKIVIDPSAGVLGEKWVKREDLLRAIDLEGHPERRLLFFSDGVESGSWIRGTTETGDSFEGELAGVSSDGAIKLCRPDGDRVDELEVALSGLSQLQAVTRSKAMADHIESLAAGEPVEFTVKGRDGVFAGRVARIDRQWISVTDGKTESHLFRGHPITAVRTLPDTIRGTLALVGPRQWITAALLTDEGEEIVRRDVTGRYQSASLEIIVLETVDGAETVSVADIVTVSVPDAERVPALTARKDSSSTDTILPVMPGMTREEVEKRIPVGIDGIELLWEDDRVATVYVRPPYPGPVFGIRFSDTLANALTKTDLVFDTQITPKDSDEVVTMVSRTLTGLDVRLLVAKSGAILAAEVSGK